VLQGIAESARSETARLAKQVEVLSKALEAYAQAQQAIRPAAPVPDFPAASRAPVAVAVQGEGMDLD
jgi:hypothetical protein